MFENNKQSNANVTPLKMYSDNHKVEVLSKEKMLHPYVILILFWSHKLMIIGLLFSFATPPTLLSVGGYGRMAE